MNRTKGFAPLVVIITVVAFITAAFGAYLLRRMIIQRRLIRFSQALSS